MTNPKYPKWTKREYAYVEPSNGNPTCGRCLAYYNQKCTLVSGKIDPKNGSCIFWGERRSKPKEGEIYIPIFDKKETLYVETPSGPRCGTCKFYQKPRKCELVAGDIDPIKGCCNAWEK